MRAIPGMILALVLASPPARAQGVAVEDVDDGDYEMLDGGEEPEWDEEWDDEDWGEEEWGQESQEQEAAPVPGEEEPDTGGDEDFALSDWIRDHLDIGGYYENQLAIFALPRHTADPDGWGMDLMDVNKLRVDLSARPLPGFSADADVILRTFHGTTKYHLADMLPGKFGAEIAMMEAVDPSSVVYRLENEIYVDNAYLTASVRNVRLRVGKQQIRFGSGYLWNPTDPFNVKDLLDPSYEKVGVTCLRLQIFLPNEGLIEAYALPWPDLDDFHLEDTALALRARTAVGRWVFATTYVFFQDLAGVDALAMDPDRFEVHSPRHMLGFEVTGEIGGMGLWGEAAFNMMRRRSWEGLERIGRPDWIEALAGLSYTFRGGTTIMVEYLYNSRGGDDSEAYTLWQWLAYLDQTIRTLGQHYATATVQVPASRIHTTFSVTSIVNVSDPSILINPWIRFDWTQHLAVMLYGAFTWGHTPESEFSSFGQAGYLRLRFSF